MASKSALVEPRAALTWSCCIALAFPPSAAAATWKLTPSISARGTYTNNLFLAPSGQRESDFYTEISPRLHLEGNGARLKLSADYQLQGFVYANNNDRNDSIGSLNARGTLEAVENFFFVDATARISNDFLSSFGPFTLDNGLINSNRSETKAFSISPYIRATTGRGYSYLVRNDSTWVDGDGSQLADYVSEWTANLRSPIYRTGWGLDYSRRDEKFDVGNSLTTELYRALLYYRPNSQLEFSPRIGHERNNYSLDDRSSALYGIGMRWTPSPRTSFAADAEHRYFGPSYLVTANHRTRKLALQATWSRSDTTFTEQLLAFQAGDTGTVLDALLASQIPDPVQRKQFIEKLILQLGLPSTLTTANAFYTNRVYLEERFEASIAMIGLRNTLTFSVFTSDREPLSANATGIPDDFSIAEKFRQRGVRLNLNHRLSARMSANLSLSRTYTSDYDNGAAESKQDQIYTTLTRQLGAKSSGSVGVRATKYKSNFSTFSDYSELAVFATFNHVF